MTQLQYALKGKVTPIMRKVAKNEGIDLDLLRKEIASGRIVIPANKKKKIPKPCGIGKGLRTKVNANIGTSPDEASIKKELAKLKASIDAGSDTVMDLSTGGGLQRVRRAIVRNSIVPVGSVPIYEAAVNGARRKGSIVRMEEEEIFRTIESHAQDGIDFMTIHCGVTRESLARLRNEGRLTDVVSRGGAFLLEWMLYNKKENPLFDKFDKVLEIARKFDVTLSLGDGLRPGSLHDATDRAQLQELILLGELAKRAREWGVQVIIEGPGHLPMHQIEANVVLQKSLCEEAPFYVLGPLVTDVAPGYDHITGAIGGAIAAASGADFLCYVTPSEHLRLPTIEDVRLGVIASRIAAHAADIAKRVNGSIAWDTVLSGARRERDWQKQAELSMDPQKVKQYRKSSRPRKKDVCTMCSDYCSLKLMDEYLGKKENKHR